MSPKLTQSEKQARKAMIEHLPEGSFFLVNEESRTSYLFVPRGEDWDLATAVRGMSEPKHSRKRAEYTLLNRWMDSYSLPVCGDAARLVEEGFPSWGYLPGTKPE
jgi:hypothetical protein